MLIGVVQLVLVLLNPLDRLIARLKLTINQRVRPALLPPFHKPLMLIISFHRIGVDLELFDQIYRRNELFGILLLFLLFT